MAENQLIEWQRIKAEIAQCSDIIIMSKMDYSLEAVQKWTKQSHQSLETQNEIAEYRLRLNRKQGEWIETNIPKEGTRCLGDKIKSPEFTLSDVGINKTDSPKFRLFARLSENKFDSYINETKEQGKELTSAGLYRIALKDSIPENEEPSKPTGKYRVIYADPPWKYSNVMPDYFIEQAHHYKTMSLTDICNFFAMDIAEDNAVLFLWTTSPILEDAFKVINAWGFHYKASFIWDKVKHNMGHYNSVRHEFLLIATRGSCQPDVKELFDSVQTIEREDHSKKPDKFRDIIETLYPNGKRIQLWARTPYEGWDNYGNELPKQEMAKTK